MSTISHTQIRKALYGLMLLGVLAFTMGAGNLPAAHAQGNSDPPTPFVEQVMPGDFEKDSPADGTTFSAGSKVTLAWETSEDATAYYFCYDQDNDDRCGDEWYWSDDTDYSLNVTGEDLDVGATYYWQAMACTKGDPKPSGCREADGGEWWSFTIAAVTFNSTGSQDGWILESSESSGTGGSKNASATTFRLGDDASDRQYRAILSFNTESLPNNAVIQSAVLKIKPSGSAVGSDPFDELGNLYASICKGYYGGSADLQLADFKAINSASKVGKFGTTLVSGWYKATLNSSGRSNINKTGLTQFRLFFNTDDNNNNVADYRKFVSGDASSYKPQLVITYALP